MRPHLLTCAHSSAYVGGRVCELIRSRTICFKSLRATCKEEGVGEDAGVRE